MYFNNNKTVFMKNAYKFFLAFKADIKIHVSVYLILTPIQQ